MASLLDVVQQNLAQPAMAPMEDQTQKARKLLAARSGKSTAGMGTESSIAEQAAVEQTSQGLADVQQQGLVSAVGIGAKQRELQAGEAQQRAELDLRRRSAVQAASSQKQQILQQLGQERDKLTQDQKLARMEQLAHVMRLEDSKYLDKLKLEGDRRRLDNDINFNKELQKSIIGSNTQLLMEKLRNDDIMSASDREFTELVAGLDLNAALQAINNTISDEREAARINAASGVASAGIKGYDRYSDNRPSSPAGAGGQEGDAEYGD